ncbi:MAG: hypothetical protein IK096_01920, partial [Lachnospiraceae bacterium]|nr:hypothetical protein [Lachnospiraceae bacterium]
RVINSNVQYEVRMEEKRKQEEMRRISDAMHGQKEEQLPADFEELDPEQLAMLTSDQEVLAAGTQDAAAQAAITEEAMAEAQAQLEEAQNEAAQIVEQANAEAQGIRDNAFQQGHDEGYQTGHQEAMLLAEQQQQEFNAKAHQLEEEYRKMVESIEPEMVDALTRIYEHVFAVRLAQDKNVILHLLSQTLSKADPTGDFLIHVSSADYETVLDARDELKEFILNPNSNLEIIEDGFLKENECMVETDGGVFDCGLGTELEELTKKLKLLSWQDRQ